jgi:hypothetical protein
VKRSKRSDFNCKNRGESLCKSGEFCIFRYNTLVNRLNIDSFWRIYESVPFVHTEVSSVQLSSCILCEGTIIQMPNSGSSEFLHTVWTRRTQSKLAASRSWGREGAGEGARDPSDEVKRVREGSGKDFGKSRHNDTNAELASRHLGRFSLGGILRAERNLSLSFLISSTREIARQRKIPLRAQNSA